MNSEISHQLAWYLASLMAIRSYGTHSESLNIFLKGTLKFGLKSLMHEHGLVALAPKCIRDFLHYEINAL